MDVWGRLRAGLSRTRARLGESLVELLGRRDPVDAAVAEALEEGLLAADVGPATTERLIARARELMSRGDIDLRQALERGAIELLSAQRSTFQPGRERPWVALIAGVNGAGKTTLAGKLAASFARQGRSTLLVAADTFRAAAAEQLELWAQRVGADLVRGAEGADPGSVVFDAVQRAAARGADLVLADTAGRLHTKVNLMEELKKVRRIAEREPARLTEVLLVIDATTGQNGLVQAKEFTEAVGVTGVVLTKLDGTAKGGIALAIQSELDIPIKLVGLGETADDLVTFDPAEFVDALFG